MIHLRHESLFHYTDFGALQGIYESGEVWATNSSYLNDISEMQLGPKVIMEVLLKRTGSKGEAVSAQLHSIQSMLSDLRANPDDAAGVYIVPEEKYREFQKEVRDGIRDANDLKEHQQQDVDWPSGVRH